MDFMTVLMLAEAMLVAAIGAAIYSVIWYAKNNQTDPATWDLSQFVSTVILGALIGGIGWAYGIVVTIDNIGVLIAGYAFLMPMIETFVKIIIRAASPAPVIKDPFGEKDYKDVLLNKKTGEVRELVMGKELTPGLNGDWAIESVYR